MELIIYSGFSKKPNSTKQPTGGTVHEVHLKNGCSVLNPVFQIDGIDLTANYCKWNNRYYYIDDIVLSNNSIYELHCSVDVLASWKAQLNASSLYITRCVGDQIDGTIADDRYPFKAVESVVQETPNINLPVSTGEGGYYVVNYSGLVINENMNPPTPYLVFSGSANFIGFLNYLTALCSTSFSGRVNWANYINEVKWYPDAPATGDAFTSVGIVGVTAIEPSVTFTGNLLGANTKDLSALVISAPNHPQSARGAWLNSPVASEVTINHPIFGSVPIDCSLCTVYGNAYAGIKVDYTTGTATLWISYGSATNPYHRTITVNYGVPVQAHGAQMNWASVISSGLQAVAGAASGNWIGATSGIMNASEALKADPVTVGNNGSRVSFAKGASVIHRYKMLTDENLPDNGRPCCKVLQLSTLSGYIECGRPDEMAMPVTPTEKDQLITFLENGIFLE